MRRSLISLVPNPPHAPTLAHLGPGCCKGSELSGLWFKVLLDDPNGMTLTLKAAPASTLRERFSSSQVQTTASHELPGGTLSWDAESLRWSPPESTEVVLRWEDSTLQISQFAKSTTPGLQVYLGLRSGQTRLTFCAEAEGHTERVKDLPWLQQGDAIPIPYDVLMTALSAGLAFDAELSHGGASSQHELPLHVALEGLNDFSVDHLCSSIIYRGEDVTVLRQRSPHTWLDSQFIKDPILLSLLKGKVGLQEVHDKIEALQLPRGWYFAVPKPRPKGLYTKLIVGVLLAMLGFMAVMGLIVFLAM